MASLDDVRNLGRRVREIEQTLDDARRERDAAIREVRRTTPHTVPELAAAAEVSTATIKTVIRGVPPFQPVPGNPGTLA